MDFNIKTYSINKTKKYVKTNSVVFFYYNNINKNFNSSYLITDKELKSTKFKSNKINNNVLKIALKKSIFFFTQSAVTNIIFFVKPCYTDKILVKKILSNNFKSFYLLFVKLNNKMYPLTKLKLINSLDYQNNRLILFYFLFAGLKFLDQKSKIRNNVI